MDNSSLSRCIEGFEPYRVSRFKHYELFVVPGHRLGDFFEPLTRLREKSFTQKNVGSNKDHDIDNHRDLLYQHILLWDHQHQALVGGMRFFFKCGSQQTEQIDKLYLEHFYPGIHQSIHPSCVEIGRVFLSSHYLQNTLLVMVMYKCLLTLVLNHKCNPIIVGLSTINPAENSQQGNDFLLRCLGNQFFYRQLTSINVTSPYEPVTAFERQIISRIEAVNSLAAIKSLYMEIFQQKLSIPILVEQYFTLFPCKASGFSVDREYNQAIVMLNHVDLRDIPAAELQLMVDNKIVNDFFNYWE